MLTYNSVMGSCGVQSQQEELEDEGEGRRPKRRSSNAGLHYSEDLSDAMFDRLLQTDEQPGSASEVTQTLALPLLMLQDARPSRAPPYQLHSMHDIAIRMQEQMQSCGMIVCAWGKHAA